MGVGERLNQVRGRIVDVDSHEAIPRTLWEAEFGEIGRSMKDTFPPGAGPNHAGSTTMTSDSAPIDEETVWRTNGPMAPSAADLTRRVDVTSEMGIDRQLVFPGFALTGLWISTALPAEISEFLGKIKVDLPSDLRGVGRQVVDGHNNWAKRVSKVDSRIRRVGIVLTDSIEQMMADAEDLLAGGVRAVWLPVGHPPADTSPADRSLDQFWALLAKARVPVVLHIGGDLDFLPTKNWKRNVAELVISPASDLEVGLDPWTLGTA